jgi:histidinol-phosphate phosphatase family protein
LTAADTFHVAILAEGQGTSPIHGQPRRAVFLDRDGTINKEVEFLTHPDQLELEDHAAEAVARLNQAGYLAVVVTNQSVVARGDVTPAGLDRIHARLEQLLSLRRAHLDRIYACPHHPGRGSPGEVGKFTVVCDCRKPATGSIDAACREMAISRTDSWFVGDTTSDVETGRRAGLKTVLVRTGHAGRDGRFPFNPDYVVADLAAAVSWILDGHPALVRRMAPVVAAAASARLVVVGGLAQSGTSSGAQVLKESMAALGRTAHVLSLDSWLNPSPQQARASGAAARYDVENMLATVTHLVNQAESTSLDLPVYDRVTRTMYPHHRRLLIGPRDSLIVEGVPALVVDGLTELADVRIHMERPDQATDEREPVENAKTRADFVISAWTTP